MTDINGEFAFNALRTVDRHGLNGKVGIKHTPEITIYKAPVTPTIDELYSDIVTACDEQDDDGRTILGQMLLDEIQKLMDTNGHESI